MLHGSLSAVLQDADGPDPRGALGLGRASTTRAAGPSTRGCATAAGRATSRSPTPRRSAAFRRVAELEGIIPALETAHALHFALLEADSTLDVVCLSGRGDKDLAEVLARS